MTKIITRTILAMSLVFWTGVARAGYIVAEGFDLFQTTTAYLDLGPLGIQPFEGTPLGTFDFGSGETPTGDADTIVQRLEQASVTGDGQTDEDVSIQLVALSLVSVNQFNLGSGSEYWHASVLVDTGSTMDITFTNMEGGSFSSELSFDVLLTGLSSGQTQQVSKDFSMSGTSWARSTDSGLLIGGVNYGLLGGGDTSGDFFTLGESVHDDGGNTVHIVEVAIPLPASTALSALGLAGLGWSRRSQG